MALGASLGPVVEAIRTWREHPDRFVREVFGATPDPWQDEVLKAFPHHRRIAMPASKGPGKAQPVDLVLDTPTGRRRFGDLRVGDSVFGVDGHPTAIVAIHDRGELPIYRVSFDDGSATLACGEHLWQVRGARERSHQKTMGYRRSTEAGTDIWVLLTTEQILARGVRNKNGRWAGRQFEIPRHEAVEYAPAILPVDPYVLGVWLGDGVRKKGCYATKPTAEIQEEIGRRGYRTKGPKLGIVAIEGLNHELRRLGIAEHYSYQRYVPTMFLRASAQQRRDLLCGLMDTDGEIADDGHMGFSSTSLELIENVQWLARSLGGVAYRKKDKKPFYYSPRRERIEGRICYRLTLNLPFNPFRVPHRRERWKDPYRSPSSARYIARKIDAIEPAGVAECRCVQVENADGLYLTNDFIVTHNTTCLAWLAWNFLSTRLNPKIAATSITGKNLEDGLWAEMAKWQQKAPFLRESFEWQKTRIIYKRFPETWWMSARTWSRNATVSEQADTLAGLHADSMLFLLDETGAMPDAVMAAAEAAMSTGGDVHVVQAGNTTNREGPLYRACTTEAHLWHVVRINGDPDDPKRSPRVDMQWAREQIEKYGRDNPWVLVNVFGLFPPSSLNSLIGPDEVAEAMRRSRREDEIRHAPKILGVDVARFGDDASVIFPRQGLVAFMPQVYRNLDTMQGAAQVGRKSREWDADAVFVDESGGYGAGWIDAMRALGHTPIGVQFASKPNDARYYNKRAEMYFELVEWIKDGGQLPPIPELTQALTGTTYTFKGDRLLLEDKDQLKARLGFSPDHADALAVTFAEQVMAKGASIRRGGRRHRHDYDPFGAFDQEYVS